LVLGFVGTILFSNIVVHTLNGGKNAGALGELAVLVSDVPKFVRSLDKDIYYKVPPGTHKGKSGFAFSYAAGSKPQAGYLALSRYDGDDELAYVELVDLNQQKVLHRWAPDTDAIFAGSTLKSNHIDLLVDRHRSRMKFRHPFITEDGGMIAKMGTPLFKVDACSKLVWMNDSYLFHHSIERDDEHTFWTAYHVEPTTMRQVNKEDFLEDGIAAFDGDGELVSTVSVAQIFLDNGMPHVVYGGSEYERNPIHLNDVEPVLADGPFWKKGDLFLSMRSPSIVMLYRPSTNKIIWHRAGPWIHQHDVDVLDDHSIAIHNNNSAEFYGYRGALGNVDVTIYDFATGQIDSPWKAALEKHNVLAETEGLYDVLPNDELFIEEHNYGRLLHLTKGGEVVWEYVNRAKQGDVYRLGWSRLLSPAMGKQIADSVAKANCSG
jgi:hypothetical protein